MKALIIAAGRGKRISGITKNKPKPLLPLLGLALIERVILTSKQAGIDEFLIVIGYGGKKIKEKLGNGSKYGVRIEYVENDEWERGNGISVLKAKEMIKENFILLMSDHLFDADIIKKLQKAQVNNECILVIDKNPEEYIDLEEATLVKIKNDRIVNIGKGLDEYDGVDCGIFLCSTSIFEALEESISKGNESLSGGIKILANKGKVKYIETKNFWIDVDNKDDHKKAEKILCKDLVKPTDGFISRHLNRAISIRISKFLVKTSITPNFLSFLSFIGCLLSALFFSFGRYAYVLIGGILAQFSSIIDGCDGEVARLKFQQTKYGAWLDAVLDRYADAFIILGMSYGYWYIYAYPQIWIIGFAALMGSFMNSYTAIKYDAIFSKKGKIRLGRDIRLFIIMVGAIFNQVMYTLLILAILTNAESIRRVYFLRED
ncbi:nucleotidyl transferase [Thermoplasmatales archaeon ex4484_30]|nr:MAG: nucleotidyl transferase [Thermoplasmatales archaeon ex4484_30]